MSFVKKLANKAMGLDLAERRDRSWEKPMRNLTAGGSVTVERMVGVYCGSREYAFDDVTVLPFEQFISRLYDGSIF